MAPRRAGGRRDRARADRSVLVRADRERAHAEPAQGGRGTALSVDRDAAGRSDEGAYGAPAPSPVPAVLGALAVDVALGRRLAPAWRAVDSASGACRVRGLLASRAAPASRSRDGRSGELPS